MTCPQPGADATGSEAARSLAIIKTRPAPSVGVTIRFTPVSSTKEDDETVRNSHELLRSRYKSAAQRVRGWKIKGRGLRIGHTDIFSHLQSQLSILHLRSSILNLLYSHSFIRSRKIAGILFSTSRRTSCAL